MKHADKYVTAVIIAMLLLAACSEGERDTGEKVQLRFQPEQGHAYQIAMEVSTKTKMMGISVPLEFKVDYTIVPVEVNDSNVVLEVTYDAMYVRSENPMTGTMTYRSDSPSVAEGLGASKVKEIHDDIVGTASTPKFDAYGRVAGKHSGKPQALGSIGASADMRNYLETMIATFPDRAVGKGDSWSKSITHEGQPAMAVENDYTITKVTANTVEVRVGGNVRTTGQDTASVSRNISGTLAGDLVVDRNTGWTLEGTITQNLTMEAVNEEQSVRGQAENKILISTK
jgi:hypothetical protein